MRSNLLASSNAFGDSKATAGPYSFEELLGALEGGFFCRVVLASLEIIRLLRSHSPVLYESFGLGAGGDRSSGADLLAEAIFCKFLLPAYNVDSEEAGYLYSKAPSSFTVVLDPLDGSNNFQSHIPYYGASLALCDENGLVCEACVVNYVSQEVSYLGNSILDLVDSPLIFRLDSLGLYLPFGLDEGRELAPGVGALPYRPLDFSFLIPSDLGDEASSMQIGHLCATILETGEDLPDFDKDLLLLLFRRGIVALVGGRPRPAKCGIFERASYFPAWASYLLERGLKFRSLGASALSIGFSFRHSFVLLPTSVRKYDGMAGFYLAQKQNLSGDLDYFCKSLPYLSKHLRSHKHIVVSPDPAIVDALASADICASTPIVRK